MSIQYMVLGFEPLEHESPLITTRPGLTLIVVGECASFILVVFFNYKTLQLPGIEPGYI